MGKLMENKRTKRESLMNTAFSLFTSKGVGKTSISDIAEEAGVAKGTFYLYFKDKYDIRNRLIAHKAGGLFREAARALEERRPSTLEDQLLFVVEYVTDRLDQDRALLQFISKNLNWGLFKTVLTNPSEPEDLNFQEIFAAMLEASPVKYRDPEIMLFFIVELVSGVCYSAIVHQEPVALQEVKPYLFAAVRQIICSHREP